MWKYVKLVLGPVLVLVAVVGSISMFDGTFEKVGREIVEGGVDTTGVIEKRVEHTVAARYRKIGGIGRYYTMTYSFTTLEGEKYSSEINISKEQAYLVNDGDKITVRYYANQPSINSALGFEEYMTEADVQDKPVGAMIAATLIMLLGGLWLSWSGWRAVRPASSAPTSRAAAYTAAPAARRGPAPQARPRSGPMFGAARR